MGYGRSRRGVAGNVVLGTLAVLGSLASAIAVGCALNPQPEPPVAAGSGATAGNGGTSGTGATGTGGAGGLGGSGGIAGGGGVSSGGTGGSTAGTGGNADSDAGVSDGGPLVPPDFSDCATAPPSTCSPSATCQALGDCGAPTSFLDTNGCLRKPCTADSECASGERCLPTSLVGGCEPSALESCAPDANGQCMCSVTSDCTSRAQCVAEILAPRDLDCAVTGLTCEELIVQTTLVMEQLHTNLAPELLDALDACRRALLEARRGGCR